MLDRIRGKKHDIDAVDEEKNEPIDKKEVDKAISLIEAAHAINCSFQVHIKLVGIEEFVVTSDTFRSIKTVNNKKEGNKVVIQYSNMLFTTDTHIDLDKITEIIVKCQYTSNEVDVNV